MGRGSLARPDKLAVKLVALRNSKNLSQNDLIRFLDLTNDLTQAEISAFERGVRLPPILVLLRYARKFEVNLEILIDDQMILKNNHQNTRRTRLERRDDASFRHDSVGNNISNSRNGSTPKTLLEGIFIIPLKSQAKGI